MNMTSDQPITTARNKGTSISLTCRAPRVYTAWLFLGLAVTSEVCGLAMMQFCVSFGRVEGLAILYLLVALSYVFLAKAVKSISVGVAYAIWEGSGIALITLVSALAFQQYLTLREMLGLSMVVIGIGMIHAGDSHDE